jgi:hypothetical protein
MLPKQKTKLEKGYPDQQKTRCSKTKPALIIITN